jgi:uncharacterized protein (TIGR02453 family)
MPRTKQISQHQPNLVAMDDFPPFPGFDPAAFKFLRDLKRNNSREWLTDERKQIYKDHLQLPMQCLLAELRTSFADEHLPFFPQPRGSMFRLYRDTRFSKDKTPYKTNIGAAVPYMSEAKEGIGNYIHIEPKNCFYGGGAYFMDSNGLKNLRAAIDRDPQKLRSILDDLSEHFGPLQGEQLKRAPVGYDENHPAIDLLRYKQMWAGITFDEKLAGSRELIDWIVSKTQQIVEFNRYLHDAIRGVGA